MTLGDGDFTYSLDLAQYLRKQLSLQANGGNGRRSDEIEVVATGIDAYAELIGKYRDTPFILEQIQKQQEDSVQLAISVLHGINALNPNEDNLTSAANHVIFNHPHLGVEDARLHSRFLLHLFHSITNFWLKRDDGSFHLTLVKGQFERWGCDEAARKYGMTLVHFGVLEPPPTDKSKYHYRRHQTGKSFATRRPGSESITYTYVRAGMKGEDAATCFPWQTQRRAGLSSTRDCKVSDNSVDKKPSSLVKLKCPFCEKEFMEERARKCHVRAKHKEETDDAEVPSKRQKRTKSNAILHECSECARGFESAEALESHRVAKHSGVHTYIAPDWSLAKKIPTTESTGEVCPICDLPLQGRTATEHLDDFVPGADVCSFTCNFCSKSFREERAVLQHENFCSKRRTH